ncbi:hypothetical protein Y032_0045g1222 [Ancylostoma ceylanicum]|uniref:Uncharacterized protein n=1 Tax=Ancylostoma ceylanicum TaxID=53326 RepID=A0A016UDP5_9BILA|nr:hypothetical protein Y032_0045g1222 [Ancylostoma ceylanicum]
MYNGTTPKFSAEAAMNLMVTASFLQMNSLMEELSNTVVNCVHPSNRLAAYRKATIRNAPLAQKLWASIVKEFRLVGFVETITIMQVNQCGRPADIGPPDTF